MPKQSPSKLHSIKVGHLNIFHLANKITDLSAYFSSSEHFHIFGISETRLGSHIPDETVEIPNYTLFRKDASKSKETGLAAYVHHSISHLVRRRADLEPNDVECLILEFKNGDKNRPVYITQVYRNPSENYEWYDKFLHLADLIGLPKNDTLLLGDFNIDMLKSQNAWDCSLQLFGLEQFIKQPTRITASTATLLDHIYSNCPENVKDASVGDLSISDHFPVTCNWLLKIPIDLKNGHTTTTFRSFKNFNKDAFLYDLSLTRFDLIYSITDPEAALCLWYALFNAVLDKHAPVRTRRVKSSIRPPWLTHDLMKAMKERDKLKKKQRFDDYRMQKKCIKKLVMKSKESLIKRTIKDKDTASIWRALAQVTKGRNQNKQNLPPNINANDLNQHFLSITEKYLPSQTTDDCYIFPDNLKQFCSERLTKSPPFNIPSLMPHEVGRFIKNMKNKNSSGPDDISPTVLKLAEPYIVESLTYIYNLCISSNIFPSEFKKAKVIPLPKSKNKSDPNNYRPISLLSTLSKPLEKYVQKHLIKYIEDNNLLHPLQSGFRANHSCHTAVTHLVDSWHEGINNHNLTGAIFLDFRKAFDLVNHEILLTKLKLYLNNSPSLDFFRSYLSCRKQRVLANGHYSSEGLVLHGVPQGSVLGPLLFSIFINDIPLCISNNDTKCELFADDGTIHTQSKTIVDANNRLSKSLKEVNDWCKDNRMVINPSKTESMVVSTKKKNHTDPLELNLTLEEVPIKQVSQHRHLGVIIDDQLRWQAHINHVCKNVSRNLFLLSKLKHITTTSTKKMFYNAHVKPHIDYCSTVWDGAAQVHMRKLNSLHRRAGKIILPNSNLTTDEKFQRLKLLPLSNHLKFNKGVFMFKVWRETHPTYINDTFQKQHSPYSNSRLNFFIPFPRIDLFKTSLAFSGPKVWNPLPNDIKNAPSRSTFKKRLKKYLLNPQRPP